MDEQLLERARVVGVEVMEDARVVGLLCAGGRVAGVRLRTHGGELLERRALVTVDATGRARALSRYLEREESLRASSSHAAAKSRARLVAFKAHLDGARADKETCEIYFYQGGYGGLSPVEGGRSNLCFIASAADVRASGGDPSRLLRHLVRSNRRADFALHDAAVCSEWLSVVLEGFGRRETRPAKGLLAVGDAASFIDPFTGSGMLMAFESGELVADSLAAWLPSLRPSGVRGGCADGRAYAALAEDYDARYEARFARRLRVCSLLRRAALVPSLLTEAVALSLGASERLLRAVARTTRGWAR